MTPWTVKEWNDLWLNTMETKQMTIAQRRKLALLEHQHRQLTRACVRLVEAEEAWKNAPEGSHEELGAGIISKDAIAEITTLIHKWELTENEHQDQAQA